jgi:hypothetical protein
MRHRAEPDLFVTQREGELFAAEPPVPAYRPDRAYAGPLEKVSRRAKRCASVIARSEATKQSSGAYPWAHRVWLLDCFAALAMTRVSPLAFASAALDCFLLRLCLAVAMTASIANGNEGARQ